MIDKLSGEVRLSDTVIVGPSLKLATFAAFPESAFWTSSALFDGQITNYERDMMDGVGRPFAVTLTFDGQKLYHVLISFYARQDTEHPQRSISQPASFHENWLREKLGDWPYQYPWGYVALAAIANTPSYGCLVEYSSNIEYSSDISQAISFSSNVNWSGGVSPT